MTEFNYDTLTNEMYQLLVVVPNNYLYLYLYFFAMNHFDQPSKYNFLFLQFFNTYYLKQMIPTPNKTISIPFSRQRMNVSKFATCDHVNVF
jgi:hypothetical protein